MTSHTQPSIPPTKRFACETRIVSGLGCIKLIPDELRHYKISKPALVVDAGIAKAGLLEQWLPPDIANISPRIASRVNPDLNQVQEGVAIAKAAHCDGVVIVGGGSAICLGKAIAVCLTNEGRIQDYEGSEKLHRPPAPTIAVPTTAGSGSEVSRALVLHEHGRRQEIVILSTGSEPRVALLDAQLLVTAPRQALLDAGLDAITHACESLWARRRSLITDALAEKALETFLDRFPAAINDRDPDALQAVLEASSAANLACGNTGLALCHAMNSSPDVPLAHGYVNGCVLLAVAGFNQEFLSERHRVLVDRLPELYKRIQCSAKFREGEFGGEYADLFVKASQGHPFRINNVRESTDEECYELLRVSGATIAAGA